jgi:hypothetical protein
VIRRRHVDHLLLQLPRELSWRHSAGFVDFFRLVGAVCGAAFVRGGNHSIPDSKRKLMLDSQQPDDSVPVDDYGIPDEAYEYALEQILKGTKHRDIRRSLADAEYTPKQIEKIIRYVEDYRRQNENKSAEPSSQNASGYILSGLFLWGVGIVFRVAGVSGGAISIVFLLSDLFALILILNGIRIAIQVRKRGK